MKNYDVIIIGSGNGGLATATCTKAGLSTLLLKRLNIPGGSASSFVRGRFEFEPSLLLIPSYRPCNQRTTCKIKKLTRLKVNL